MAESIEEPEGEIAAGAADFSAAAALAVGAKRARSRAAGDRDAKLDAFLEMQTELVGLQKEHLHEQRELVLSRLRWGRFSDRIKAGLQVMTGLVGLFIVIAIAAMAWQAHDDHGVSIEAFSVPPDLAQRGLPGQVVASELLDRLSELQSKTVTRRPAASYADDWGRDIKVEIPETGVSIGELNRYLRDWLGGETRITGEVVRTPAGLAVTARAGAAAGRRFEGPEADLDKLIGLAAESVYAQTQPYRYAVYLASTGRADQALVAYRRLAETGAPEDRPWAYVGWGAVLMERGDFEGAVGLIRKALALEGSNDAAGAGGQLFAALHLLSHWQDELANAPHDARPHMVDFAVGDNRWQVAHPVVADTLQEGGIGNDTFLSVMALSRSHDISGALRVARGSHLVGTTDPTVLVNYLMTTNAAGFATFAYDDWPGVERGVRSSPQANPGIRIRFNSAMLANAASVEGRTAEAEALIAPTPIDCDICVDARAVIAARKGDWAAAWRWIDMLEARTPQIPFAPTDHGKLLLDHGDTDAAIAELAKAHRISPHFADPLELWGEALMKKGDFAGAAAKFAEADRSAPRWGRNHMLRGEALMLSGRYREARAELEAANGMDLTKPDRAALNVLLARTASGHLHG